MYYRFGATSDYWFEIGDSLQWWAVVNPKFRVEVIAPTNHFLLKKLD